MKNDVATKSIPLGYLITCRTYATWLHGDERASVDKYHNAYLTPKIKPNAVRYRSAQSRCLETPFILNAIQRETVLESIINTCHYARWHLHAAHVRSNHMHIVVSAEKEPEKMAVSFKAYATRYLKKQCVPSERVHFWTKGHSTRYLFENDFFLRAIQYTVDEQGEKMAVYCEPDYCEITGKECEKNRER